MVLECFVLVYKKILRLEEELEALGGENGGETTRSNVIKTPNLTPRKVLDYSCFASLREVFISESISCIGWWSGYRK